MQLDVSLVDVHVLAVFALALAYTMAMGERYTLGGGTLEHHGVRADCGRVTEGRAEAWSTPWSASYASSLPSQDPAPNETDLPLCPSAECDMRKKVAGRRGSSGQLPPP